MDYVVSTTKEISSALALAQGGDRILLNPGSYDSLNITGLKFAGDVTIASADPLNRAVVAGVELTNASGLRFDNLDLTVSSRTQLSFSTSLSSNITLQSVSMHDPITQMRGGALFRYSSDIVVTASDFYDTGTGLRIVGSRNVTVADSRFHDLSGDGIQSAGSSYVTLTGNTFTDFYPKAGDHPDAIQFFTTGTAESATNITITNNVISRGVGDVIQGIFFGNEISLPYQQVLIQGNSLTGTMYNGIAINVAENVTISDNVVRSYSDMNSWIYAANVSATSITNNQAASFVYRGVNDIINALGNTQLPAVAVAAPAESLPPNVQRGTPAADVINGGRGEDQLWGDLGDDSITGGQGANLLRGEEGNDTLIGGNSFDDMHGNTGNDSLDAGGGSDWVVGGQGNDYLYAGEDDDLVYGQLGQDTLDGASGNDSLVGGQADDILRGGVGNDYLTGDRGDDTMTGGAGADRFHTFDQAGLDVITDFKISEGDRIQLDPGASYTVSQVGADTVISLAGGGRAVLLGVDMATLPAGWIFGF